MSKAKPSKLDQFTEQLDEWFLYTAPAKTLAFAQEELRKDGCRVSLSQLSRWWEARQETLREEKLLGQITNGAGACKAVEKQFGEAPPPELDTLIKLHRVLVMQMSTQAATNPEMIKLADQGLRTVMEYVSGKTKAAQKERELTLAEGKFAYLQKEDLDKALAALHAELKALPGGDQICARFEADIKAARERAKK
jgi:hypothetical protein